jgi:hypothetical protein
VEPLRWFGMNWQRRCFGWTLLWWWICRLVGGVVLRGYYRRLDVLYLQRWWEWSGLAVRGGVGYWWIFVVVLCLDVDIGSFFSVALSGLSSSLEHGGGQMLG